MHTIIAFLVFIVLALSITFFALQGDDASTVGSTQVPADLTCQEDELIGFLGPDTLGCVHIDTLN